MNHQQSINQVRVIFDIPLVSEVTDEFYVSDIAPHISLHELMTTMIYIEFIADSEDRSPLRHDYIAHLQKKFQVYNVGRLSNVEFLHQCIRIQDHIGVSVERYLNNPDAVWNYDANVTIERRKKRYGSKYLNICTRIDDLYETLRKHVLANTSVRQTIDSLLTRYGNIRPKVEPMGGRSIVLTFIDFSVL